MKIKYLTNVSLAITGSCLILTGLGLATVDWDIFEEIHGIAGAAMSGLLCLHVYLNRSWFRKYVFKNT